MREKRAAVPDVVDDIMDAWRTQDPSVAHVAAEISKRIARLDSLLHAATDRALEPFGFQKAEFGVLSALRRMGPHHRLKPNELARSLLISSGGTSNVLRRLEQAGLIERGVDPNDQRSSWVRLTREGVRITDQAVRVYTAAQAEFFRPVAERTARDAADLLREVLVAVGDASPRAVGAPIRRARRG
ncbi:MarR family transcriptional regulator [Pendulispora brunnea]|uniref:MarR family transcriptional regulator n=1 Tax=Pendulispora brunnea TaxID=2905690 RepID=A0ABZ2K1B5_9BACT